MRAPYLVSGSMLSPRSVRLRRATFTSGAPAEAEDLRAARGHESEALEASPRERFLMCRASRTQSSSEKEAGGFITRVVASANYLKTENLDYSVSRVENHRLRSYGSTRLSSTCTAPAGRDTTSK